MTVRANSLLSFHLCPQGTSEGFAVGQKWSVLQKDQVNHQLFICLWTKLESPATQQLPPRLLGLPQHREPLNLEY